MNNYRCNRCGKCPCSCFPSVMGVGGRGPAGPVGPQGPIGPRGPAGPPGVPGASAATIPFAISGMSGMGVELGTDEQGNPSILTFAGFGPPTIPPITLYPGDWTSGTIPIREGTFYPSAFVMPRDGVVRGIYALFANRQPFAFNVGVTMRPFVCLAASTGNNLVFSILQNTMTFTEPYVGLGDAQIIPKYSVRRGSLTGIEVPIAAGTLVGIVVGWMSEGTTDEQLALFSVSGGLYIE